MKTKQIRYSENERGPSKPIATPRQDKNNLLDLLMEVESSAFEQLGRWKIGKFNRDGIPNMETKEIPYSKNERGPSTPIALKTHIYAFEEDY